ARRGLGELRPSARAERVLDVTRAGEARAVLRVDDGDAWQPVLFLGASGHGVVCSDGARLRLVRLRRPASPPLRQLVLAGEPLPVPSGELQRFAEELCPALARVAPVVSSDGSFAPPAISPPALVLRARYGGGHDLELGWEWAYRAGERIHREPLAPPAGGPGVRDLDAERALLAGTVLAGTGLERYGLLDESGRPASETVALSGLDSMRFTTEALPLLRELGGATLEVEGQQPDYRDVGDSLEIALSTAEIAGERDWFDLGVTISVEGRGLPFAEVFVALASGQSHILLDDGAHFSLDDPRLQSLRALIEEARELADAPTAPLRISRYQSAL